jgi:protein O-GlcNAc transferase
VTPTQLLKTVVAVVRHVIAESKVPMETYKQIQPSQQQGRIKVAYFSSWMIHHPVGFCLHRALQHHDRSKFEIFCYSTSKDEQSAVREQIVQHCEHFVDLSGKPDFEMSNIIREAKIDILLDVNGIWELHKYNYHKRKLLTLHSD